jgi:hypothetical protein
MLNNAILKPRCNETSKMVKATNFSEWGSLENLLFELKVSFIGGFLMAKKPMTAEEEKKKQAYYSKTEKKAKEVKK